MLGKMGKSIAVVIAGCFVLTCTQETQAQCCGSSGRGFGSMMQGSAMQQLAAQRLYSQMAMQQYMSQLAMQQRLAQQQFGSQTQIKNSANTPKAAKASATPAPSLYEPRPDFARDNSSTEPADPEQQAAAAMSFVKPLVTDPSKRVFARLQLRQIADQYPNTASASQAMEMLKKLQ